MRRQGAQDQPLIGLGDEAELRIQGRQVDEVAGGLTATAKLDHNVGTARDQPHIRTRLGELSEGFGERGGAMIDLDHPHMFEKRVRLSSSRMSHLRVIRPDNRRTASSGAARKRVSCI